MKQLSVMMENRTGALADVCEALGKVGVNIVSLFGGGFDATGILHLITSDERTTERVLRGLFLEPKISDVMTIRLADKPGELGKAARKLAYAGVNIESIYMLGREKGMAELVLKVSNEKAALKALEHGREARGKG